MNSSNPIFSPARILVVDDHPHTAELLARVLSQLGLQVHVISATSAHQALEYVKKGAIDILITDMDMPEMTGLELIKKLQEHPAGSRIVSVLFTASHAPELETRARHLNVREVLHKPVHPERVCQIVNQVLEEMDRELT